MACVAVNSLIRTLELEFLQPNPRPILQEMELIIPFHKELIKSLLGKLGFLIELLDESRMDSVGAVKDLETELRDVAFRLEDDIELHVVDLYIEADNEEFGIAIANLFGVEPQWDREAKKTRHSTWLRHVLQQAIQDIDAIKEEVEKVRMEYKHVTAVQARKTTLDDVIIPKSDEHVKMESEEGIMVGKNNEFETIREMLIKHPSKQREIVSIQGMGGIGKTTLARQIYEDPSIISHFDKRAWVVISQHHNKRQMLQGLLNSVGNARSDSDEDLAIRLYQGLKGLRYLVVMDDVWSGQAWDAIKSCFPDDINGSRVLLTTRIANVATHIGSNHNFSHQMHLLDRSESWDLFSKKACQSQGVEFETIARTVVMKCQGLPLAIVVVAGLLSKLNTLDEWKNTANALSSSTSTLDDECSRILSMSYTHLPYNLKACFLYFGSFPEDKEINANDLARLWAAEGLVKAFKNESSKAVARRYIKELIDRNLILVSERSCCGRKIKTCRLHDLLHALCVREAQNQSLLHVVHGNGSNLPQKGVRWVRIQLEDFDISVLHSCSKNCRSIFYFVWNFVCLDLDSVNLWRVLYSTTGFYMRRKTLDLIHLRYLRAFGNKMDIDDILPFKTWNLQTLANMHSYVGRNILEFPQLHYIHSDVFNGTSPKSVHQNLQTIISLEPRHCTQEYFKKIPYLKKVSIEGDSKDWHECTKNLVCLQQLENLRICYYGLKYARGNIIEINNICLLENLRKLAFGYLRLEWKEIEVLSKLPRLEVLKLFDSVEGEEWEVSENVKFCKLICLRISSLNFKYWEASAYHFPRLERLLLHDCYQLTEIPNSFVEISTLNLIELSSCLASAVMSAKQIQAEQHDWGNDDMVVIENDTI